MQDLRSKEVNIDRLKWNANEFDKEKWILEASTGMKILDRISWMNTKELEQMVVQYENKLNVLISQLTACETSNQELISKLREEKLSKRK